MSAQLVKKPLFSTNQLRRLILPLFAEQLLTMLVGMLDTIMVSSAGEAVISGVSIVNDANNLAVSLLSALAGGGSVVVAQFLGNRDRDDANLAAGQLVAVAFAISFGLAGLCLLFNRQILNTLYGSVAFDVMDAALVYFRITLLSLPFLAVYNASAALFRVMNLTRFTMFVSLLMNAVNVLGNAIGIYVLHMGAAGVAWPTTISRVVAAVVMTGMAFRDGNPIRLISSSLLSFHKTIVGKILTIAVPNGVENGLFQFGKISVSVIISTFGTAQIAANGVTNSLSVLCYATETAMQLAMVTVVGRCVGAGDYKQARYYTVRMIRMAFFMAVLNNILVFCFAPFALQLYTLSEETRAIASTILLMEGAAVALLHAPAFVLPCALRAAGDACYTMVVGVLSVFLARVLFAYIFGSVMGLGVVGTRLAMYIDWTVRIVLFTWRYRSLRWMKYRVVG